MWIRRASRQARPKASRARRTRAQGLQVKAKPSVVQRRAPQHGKSGTRQDCPWVRHMPAPPMPPPPPPPESQAVVFPPLPMSSPHAHVWLSVRLQSNGPQHGMALLQNNPRSLHCPPPPPAVVPPIPAPAFAPPAALPAVPAPALAPPNPAPPALAPPAALPAIPAPAFAPPAPMPPGAPPFVPAPPFTSLPAEPPPPPEASPPGPVPPASAPLAVPAAPAPPGAEPPVPVLPEAPPVPPVETLPPAPDGLPPAPELDVPPWSGAVPCSAPLSEHAPAPNEIARARAASVRFRFDMTFTDFRTLRAVEARRPLRVLRNLASLCPDEFGTRRLNGVLSAHASS